MPTPGIVGGVKVFASFVLSTMDSTDIATTCTTSHADITAEAEDGINSQLQVHLKTIKNCYNNPSLCKLLPHNFGFNFFI